MAIREREWERENEKRGARDKVRQKAEENNVRRAMVMGQTSAHFSSTWSWWISSVWHYLLLSFKDLLKMTFFLANSFTVSLSPWVYGLRKPKQSWLSAFLSWFMDIHSLSLALRLFVCLCNIVRALFTWLLWSKCAHDILVFEVDYDTMQTFKRVL